MVAWLARSLPPSDVAVLSRPAIRELMVRNARRPFAATAARACVQDFTLEIRPWGFALEDIKMHVHVWHGEADRNVPVGNGAYVAATVHNATFHRLPEEGHALFHDHFAELLDGVTEDS